MVITKRKDLTKQGFCKILWKQNSVFGRVSYHFLLEFELKGVRLDRGGRLFEVGANSRLHAYSNKYGRYWFHFKSHWEDL